MTRPGVTRQSPASSTVVAAGAKAILDLPKTLEVLETSGVPVIAYGQDDFPAFWSRDSGLASPLRIDAPEDIARAHLMRARLGLPGPVGHPVPEEHALGVGHHRQVAAVCRAEAGNAVR